MPNHARNQLLVFGDYPSMSDFWEKIKATHSPDTDSKYRIINTLFPCPEPLTISSRLDDNISDELREAYLINLQTYGHPTWYDWCIANWGTKWGDYDTDVDMLGYKLEYPEDYEDVELSETFIRFKFDTAWSQPVAAFEHISTLYPSLTFELITTESGMEWKRKAVIQNGHAVVRELKYHQYWDAGYA